MTFTADEVSGVSDGYTRPLDSEDALCRSKAKNLISKVDSIMLQSKAWDQSRDLRQDSNPTVGQVKASEIDFFGSTPTITDSEVDLTEGAEALLMHKDVLGRSGQNLDIYYKQGADGSKVYGACGPEFGGRVELHLNPQGTLTVNW